MLSFRNTILICGLHSCIAALENPRRKCLKLLVSLKKINKYKELIEKFKHKIAVEFITEAQVQNLMKEETVHQGIILIARPLPIFSLQNLLKETHNQEKCTVVALDQVKDPRNIGAILRICAAFNVDFIILPKDNTPPETFSMAKTASGALDIVPLVTVTNLRSAIDYLKAEGFWCYGIENIGNTVIDLVNFSNKALIIFGSEESGLRRLTLESCDYLINIPISSKMESLNVASAAAIVLHKASSKNT